MNLVRLKDLKFHGFSKFMHQIFLILTYPVRKPVHFLICIFIIIVLIFAIPMIKGVPFTKVLPWYFSQKENISIDSLASKMHEQNTFRETPILETSQKKAKFKKVIKLQRIETEEKPKDEIKTVQKSKESSVQEQKEAKTEANEKKESKTEANEQKTEHKQYVIWNISQKPQNIQKPVVKEKEIIQEPIKKDAEIKESKPAKKISSEAKKVETKPKVEAIIPLNQKFQIKNFYRKVDDLDLSYVDQPKIIKGTAMVYGPNELYIDDTYLYLYGIYTDPVRHDFLKATQYLRELLDGGKIECHIIAYTVDQIATAVCFINGRSVNQNMVDAGMARNVAL